MFSAEDAFGFFRRLKDENLAVSVCLEGKGISQWISPARVFSVSEPKITLEYGQPRSILELTVGKSSKLSDTLSPSAFALSRISQQDWPALTIASPHGWTACIIEHKDQKA